MGEKTKVADHEDVVRLLSTEWIVDSVLSNAAFTLRPNETYISVNRPAIASYVEDVAVFIEKHPSFAYNAEETYYMLALLHVSDIRRIQAGSEDSKLNLDVDIEPRDVYIKSHAGIFTRYEGRNLKCGDTISVMGEAFSADDVLLEVRTQLVRLSTIDKQSVVEKP